MENELTIEPFTKDRLIRVLAPEQTGRGDQPPLQVGYLANYCEMLKAKTIVCESQYVDRHYIDEFAAYYSRKLSSPSNLTRRVHLFSHELSKRRLQGMFERAFKSCTERSKVEKKLCDPPEESGLDVGYLGYIVVRPIPTVPIGRTVLVRLPHGETPRNIWATNIHTVHLGNLTLRVDGLAFQQQDAAVGACATAALWSALTCVARYDGMRAPTPAEITDVAVRNPRPSIRTVLPANHGLTIYELCDATRAFGFSPEMFYPEIPEHFVSTLQMYLLSGIPVVLGLDDGLSGHAVTAVGFQLSTTVNPVLQGEVPFQSAKINKIYIHDDRLGPYARAHLRTASKPPHPIMKALTGEDLKDEIWLELQIEQEIWRITCAFAPVYPKLRLSHDSLLKLALYMNSPIEKMVGPEIAVKLQVSFRYERSGTYLGRLSGRINDPKQAARFAQRVSLSRWCGIIRWHLEDSDFIELVYDATDVVREAPFEGIELLKAIVSLCAESQDIAKDLGTGLEIPWV